MRLYLGSDANVVSAHFYGRDNRTLVVIHQDGKNRLLLYQLINKYRVLLYIWHQMSSTGTGYAKLYFTVINNKINKLKKNIHSRRESMSDQRGYSYWSMCSVGASLTGPDLFPTMDSLFLSRKKWLSGREYTCSLIGSERKNIKAGVGSMRQGTDTIRQPTVLPVHSKSEPRIGWDHQQEKKY